VRAKAAFSTPAPASRRSVRRHHLEHVAEFKPSASCQHDERATGGCFDEKAAKEFKQNLVELIAAQRR
jgi:hypothetical protein